MAGITSKLWFLIAAGYLLGSIPFGLIFAKLFGAGDVRTSGSGNIGATNVARVAGPVPGILTLLFDAGKGAAAVLLARQFTANPAEVPLAMMAAGLAALIGHCFSIWLGFHGGKGVATALGVFLVIAPLPTLIAVVFFVLVVWRWRFVSLGSIAAAAALPLLVYVLWAPGFAPPLALSLGTLLAAALIIFKHRGNIQRLLSGTEPRFGRSRSEEESS